jgi:hypothetical protein
MANKFNIGANQRDTSGQGNLFNIGAYQTDIIISGGTTYINIDCSGGAVSGGSAKISIANFSPLDASGGGVSGGSGELLVITLTSLDVSGGATSGGSAILGISEWLRVVTESSPELDVTLRKIITREGAYFGDVNSTAINSVGLMTFAGEGGPVLPHLMQSDTTDQSIIDITDEQVITFDTDVHHDGVTRTSNSRFTITKPGSYLLTFSAVVLSGVAGKKIVIWAKKNGVNIDDSATYYTFKSSGANTIITVTFLYHFVAGDYFEFWMWGDNTGIKLDSIPAVAFSSGVTPAIPACPSIIMTCNYVGRD